ncbi:hypothetical protein [Streptomyces sp. NPDC051909]|uniref:hypothetical protein n=1 Tax=Streptomyces sp. NPDC051909 TaxID=3154944 RepID=UPI003435A99E
MSCPALPHAGARRRNQGRAVFGLQATAEQWYQTGIGDAGKKMGQPYTMDKKWLPLTIVLGLAGRPS